MASVASQLIEEVTAYALSDSLKVAREICADGTYFPNNLCNIITHTCSYSVHYFHFRCVYVGDPYAGSETIPRCEE